MKITIKNLGVLESAEYELGDLTVVCGKNNTGKTYAAYALYGFLNYWRNEHEFQVNTELFDEMQNNAEVLIAQEQIRDWLPKNLEQACKKYCSEQLPKSLGYSSDFLELFKNCEFSVNVDETSIPLFDPKERFRIIVPNRIGSDGSYDIKIIPDTDGKSLKIHKQYQQIAQKISFNPAKFLPRFISKEILPHASFASADRIGAAMFSNEIRYLRDELYQKNENSFDRMPIDYPLPVSTNLNTIRDSLLSQPRLIDDIKDVFSDLLGGNFKSVNGKLYFIPSNNNNLSLTVTESSSSVRSLLSLWLQLCNETRQMNFPKMFMIDEPEMNLHPENQCLLARIFARLVNVGYKIYITTHSDYIVKELNTLIILNRRNKNNDDIMKQYGYSEKEFLDPNKVRVYMAQEIETEKKTNYSPPPKCTFIRADIDELGIDLPSFDTTIDRMNRIQMELLAGDDDDE
ncbi:MAG: ATP-binding protein [Planctomycetaceae bacterium]|jgi:predicted ATP-dependent endonuclease of OLD family|nr:ATP-binding protein [Planctomycetaceae bacterium]